MKKLIYVLYNTNDNHIFNKITKQLSVLKKHIKLVSRDDDLAGTKTEVVVNNWHEKADLIITLVSSGLSYDNYDELQDIYKNHKQKMLNIYIRACLVKYIDGIDECLLNEPYDTHSDIEKAVTKIINTVKNRLNI